MIRYIRIRPFEVGLVFRHGTFRGLLGPGAYLRFDPLFRERVHVVSQRAPWLVHEQLDLIVRSGVPGDDLVVLDLADHERGLVWIDGRFATVLPPGLYALWTTFRRVRTEVVDARAVRFDHPERDAILRGGRAAELLDVQDVPADHAGLLFLDGRYAEALGPGRYAFWKHGAAVRLVRVDRRETVVDVPGQDILTADKVTLRLTAVVVYRVADPLRSVTHTDDAQQALYREAQLALRAAVGVRELDAVLAEKDALARDLTEQVRARAAAFGLDVSALGIRDVILPGDMKELMNKVIEARKAAEANVITRREEAASLRHQANAAKLLAENPTLQRLRELEAVEKIATAGKLNVVLGEKGLTDRVVNLL
ncbi:MAG TPA: slipin family protein [Gemmataceae bacterium]|jgi:regulator of protease activity HflC (stomatin/prohibitin superfamily)